MPTSNISGDSLLLIQVDTLCHTPAITCEPGIGLVEIARTMRDHDISGLVVVEDNAPIGVVSLSDIRNHIAETGGTGPCTARDLMSGSMVTIRHRARVFEAIFKMAKHNIHRLAVVDENGGLIGTITDTDLLRLQTCTPLYLNQEIDAAQSVEQLAKISDRMLDIVKSATQAGASARSLAELIAHFNDTLTLRIIALMDSIEGLRLPDGAAFLVLGSQGRGEQTLRTDQDSAIIYNDDLSADRQAEVARFSSRLCEALDQIGIPRCPGDTMASNPQWRQSVSGWKRIIDHWFAVPTPENMVNFGMFQDYRVLCGNRSFEKIINDHIQSNIQRNALFLAQMARHLVRFQPPLGMFGRIRVERRGENRGKVDLKKAGIFAVTEGASLLGLEAGIVNGTTWDKLERLGQHGILAATDAETISDAMSYLVHLRLQRQVRAMLSGQKPSNHIDPLVMTDKERDRLREALKGVGMLQKILRDRFRVDFISR
ncbi:putative nucleotidyltransferase substrate binding domain-containing protein [Trichloromonas sp.]|uniref:putative nucleotidyltransferase substrate binding domain-containing protein n=1 Tax=Trichloromonas sp. TaxID=3069249 RepID=UPI003D817D34